MFHDSAVSRKVPNLANIKCLRPKTDEISQAAFWPLFEKRNAVMNEQSVVSEKLFHAIRMQRPNIRRSVFRRVLAALGLMAFATFGMAANVYAAQLENLNKQVLQLNAQMEPLQFLAWERTEANVVTNVGRNDILDKYWRGSSYTQTVVMGLAGSGTKAAADTQSSHAGWSEVGGTNAPAYTGNRKAVTMGAASSQSSVSPQQTYAITSSGTVSGLFMNNGGSSTKDDTSGVLVSAVNFTGGDEVVNNGDSLLVTYTFNA